MKNNVPIRKYRFPTIKLLPDITLKYNIKNNLT